MRRREAGAGVSAAWPMGNMATGWTPSGEPIAFHTASSLKAPSPVEEGSFHIVFTADPGKYEQTGWSRAHFESPEPAPRGPQ